MLLPVFAQDIGGSISAVYNLPTWGASLLTFSLALAVLTQAVKSRLKGMLEHVPHYLIHGSTFAIALVMAALIQSEGLLVDPLFSQLTPPLNWLLYGGLAGVGAIGGFDLLQNVAAMFGSKGTILAPTIEEAEAQVTAVPKLAVDGLRTLATNFGIPGFVVSTLLNEHTFAEAERIIREMGKERALTEGEIKNSQDAFEKSNPVVRNPAPANTVVTKPGGQK